MTRRTGARRFSSWLALVTVVGGCTAEFIVGAQGESSSGSADDSADPSEGHDDGASNDTLASDTQPTETTTTESETTPSDDTGGVETSQGVEASAESPETGIDTGVPETGDPTEAGSVDEAGSAEAGTTGEPVGTPCSEPANADGCEEDWHCDWFGDGESGACWHDPCLEGVAVTCDGLAFEACAAAPVCIWIGELEGECTYPDCSALEMAQCLEAPACDWNGEMCADLECAQCEKLGMEACAMETPCQWVASEEICSSS